MSADLSIEVIEDMLQSKKHSATAGTFGKSSVVLPHGYYNSSSDDLIRVFFKTAYRYSLLTAEEEIKLARQVKFLVAVEEQRDRLTQELGRTPKLTELAQVLAIGEHELEQRCEQGRAAKRKMICSNLRLVFWIAKKYSKQEVPLPDLVQEGVLGLNRAVEKFDPEKGYKFSTYAYWWIRQGVTQLVANDRRAIRLPTSMIAKLNKLKQANQDLYKKLGRKPSEAELAQAIELSPKRLWLLRQMYLHSLSLNYLVGQEGETELGDLLEDTSQSPEKQTAETMMTQEVRNILGSVLTGRERDIIVLLYGLDRNETYTLNEVGNMFNLSTERVRQIQARAICKLRHPRVAKRLKIWLEGL